MRFGILGATQAWDADGGSVALGGPGRRAALALLALDAGRIVTVQRMIDGLYGEEPPAGVGNALQSQISRLRSALRKSTGPDGAGPIENHPAGYRLAVDPDQVDVHRFTRLAGEGREALTAGDATAATALLGEALALWQGPALADVSDAPFAGPQIVRLEELRLGTEEDRVQAQLTLGEHPAVVDRLRELVAAHPLRERLSAQLVRALHGSGRQAEALAVFAAAREALAEELGADPGPELAAAHLAVLRGETGRPGRPGRDVPRETSSPQRLSLPARLSELVGRARESARIRELLRAGRLVTVTGPGGAGKTRISVETAAGDPQDSCFTDLSGLPEGSDLAQAVLSALGLRSSGLVVSADGPSTLERLTSALADRPMLLVLDNCEHLIADAARLVAELLAGCPELRILATSREALGITGERQFPLPPLPGPAAVQLFTERARAVRPDFDPEQDEATVATVAEICRRLDGLPLAIELAAARLRMLSPRQIADRLDDRFRLLTGGSRTARPRQQTLRAVVDWSWDLLPEAERGVLRRASVFSGGWTLEAAEAVCSTDAGTDAGTDDALELIGSLVDKSLVGTTINDDGSVRYRMLQTVRAYAAERLAESGELAATQQAHRDWFLALATEADPHLRSAEQVLWLHRLAADHDNLHAALRGADPRTALRLVGELAGYWLLRGLRFEGGPHARRVLEAVGPEPIPGYEEEFAICVVLVVTTPGWREDFLPHLAAAEQLMRGFRSTPRRYPALTLLWAPFSGVPEDMEQMTAEDLALWSADPWYTGLIRIGEAFRHLYVTADLTAAEENFNAAEEVFRRLGDRWGRIMSLGELAAIAEQHGDAARAEALVAESLLLAEELGAAEDMADLLVNRAERRVRAGRLDEAVADCERAVGLFRLAGSPDSSSRARLCLADVARLRGDPATARALCLTVLTAEPPGWFGGDWLRISVLLQLGRIAGTESDPVTARAHYREALPYDVDRRNLPVLALAAECVAGLALLEGAAERAAFLLGVSRALRRGEGSADADRQQVAAGAAALLGAERYERVQAAGAALAVPEALRALTEEAQRG